MSRTFTLEKPLFNSDAHESQTRIERAMREGNVVDDNGNLVTKFQFDLLGFVHDLKTPRLKNDALNRVAFTIDAYISGALSRMLNQFYQHYKAEDSAITFATYHDFLAHIEGLEASEQSLYETGCDVKPSIAGIRNLIEFRDEVHAQIALQLLDPSKYVQPDLREFLLKPKVREISAAAELGLKDIVADDAGDDKELAEELLAQYKLDTRLEYINQHRMDMMKAKSLVLLLDCLKVDPGANVNDESDAFFNMEPRVQYALLNAVMRSLIESRRKAVIDNRLPVMEKATMRVEAKAAITAVTAAMAHPIFSEFTV